MEEGELSLPFLNLSRCFGRATGAPDLPDFYRGTAFCRFLTAATAKLEEDRSSAFEVEKSRHSGEVWEGEGGETFHNSAACEYKPCAMGNKEELW